MIEPRRKAPTWGGKSPKTPAKKPGRERRRFTALRRLQPKDGSSGWTATPTPSPPQSIAAPPRMTPASWAAAKTSACKSYWSGCKKPSAKKTSSSWKPAPTASKSTAGSLALGLRAVVLESCHVGKHAKTYADNDKMAAARIALVYLAGNAPCVWVPDALSCERRELLAAHQNAVGDHTAALNSLKGYLNQFAIRPGSRNLHIDRARAWVLKERDWTPLQRELLGSYFTQLDSQDQPRKALTRLIAAQVTAEPLMLCCGACS